MDAAVWSSIIAPRLVQDEKYGIKTQILMILSLKLARNLRPQGYNQDDPIKERYHKREDSLPCMAFADELFLNGLVMPLKLPPRLQYDSDVHSISQRSFASTPRSPRTTCRIPFARQNAWDDDFDPFTVALKKVREEKKGNDHRRSKSHSLFTTSKSKCSTPREGSPMSSQVQVSTPTYSMPMESKGSAYARWVRNQTKEVGLSPKGPKSPRGLFFGGRVRPVQTESEGSNKPFSTTGIHGENAVENKVQKFKGLLLRFATFGREKSKSKQTKKTSEPWTPRKFRQSSFRFEGNGCVVGKETMPSDANMAVAEYKKPMKPTLALCLGYGVESPRNMK
ncbi:uncharacterized protein Fot_17322 [Forsythia ovata]|uniref:Uncharacterized protein n=1 Tax=Forsythia ovata TaxID=205694 RepID=A0ABD1VF08_9LAMI